MQIAMATDAQLLEVIMTVYRAGCTTFLIINQSLLSVSKTDRNTVHVEQHHYTNKAKV